jgi:hypothetical protein
MTMENITDVFSGTQTSTDTIPPAEDKIDGGGLLSLFKKKIPKTRFANTSIFEIAFNFQLNVVSFELRYKGALSSIEKNAGRSYYTTHNEETGLDNHTNVTWIPYKRRLYQLQNRTVRDNFLKCLKINKEDYDKFCNSTHVYWFVRHGAGYHKYVNR